MKKVLFYSFLFFLFIPLLKQINIFPVQDFELDGNFELQSDVELNWHNWINGVYQNKADAIATEHIGYRGFATRLRNQIDYSFFKLAHSDKAIVGKDNILFDEWYLNAWTGRTFIGEDFIDIKLHKLKMVQDTLRKLGTELIFVLAPDKATFFEDKIPDYYQQNKFGISNYSYLTQRSKEIKINFIDLNTYFLAIKDTIPHPLYPKSGIHWSTYGSYIALDTIIKYIENTKQIDLNDITIDDIEITNIPKHPDYDIGQNINLLRQIPQWDMAYPKLSFEDNPNKPKPKMLVTGDSYYFNIYSFDFTEHLFSNNAFWYYANWVYPEYYKERTEASSLNFRKEIEDKDILLMMVTGRFMHNIDWLVIEKLFNIYYPNVLWKKNYDRRASIHIDHDYFYWLVEGADKMGLTIDEKLNIDANYLLSMENSTPNGKCVYDYIEEMDNNREWLQQIEKKAKQNNETLRDQKILDGLFLWKEYNTQVINKESEIRNEPAWFEKVVSKANESGISVDVQLRNEAIFIVEGGLIEETKSEETAEEKDLQFYINKIRNSPEWMKSIEEKALKNKVSIEEQIKLDAAWTLENEK